MSFLKKLKLFWVNNIGTSNKKKIKYLESEGAVIGKGTRLNCKISSFGTEPYLIRIGENCLLAKDIDLITHDGAIKVLNSLGKFENNMDKMGPVIIGNNVYVGVGAFVMPNVHIGDNSIIGAGAIVTKDIPANSVAVGIPARVICSTEDYYNKCRDSLDDLNGMDQKQKRDYLINKYMK